MRAKPVILNGAMIAATLVLLILAAVRVGGALVEVSGPAEFGPAAERVLVVQTMLIETMRVTPTIAANGQVRARRSLEIRAPVAGTITDIADEMREGGEAAAGGMLFRIDPEAAEREVREAAALLAQARADMETAAASLPFLTSQVEMAKIGLDLRQANAGRVSTLQANKLVTQASKEDALFDLAVAERDYVQSQHALLTGQAHLARTRAEVDRSQVVLERRQRELAQSTFHAPFDGRLADVAASLGRRVAVNERLATLIQTRSLEVEFKIRLAEYARLIDHDAPDRLMRLPVRVQLDFQHRTVVVPGWLDRTAARVEPGQGGRTLYARLDVADGSPLRPGDFVSVTVEEPALADVVVLPRSAVDDDGGILVVGDDGHLQDETVTVVRRQGGHLVVTGAPVGREVVLNRTPVLRAGTLVAPRRLARSATPENG